MKKNQIRVVDFGAVIDDCKKRLLVKLRAIYRYSMEQHAEKEKLVYGYFILYLYTFLFPYDYI